MKTHYLHLSILSAMLLFSSSVFAQQRRFEMDECQIKDEIRYQLAALERENLSMLSPYAREQALRRLDEIYFLLDQLNTHQSRGRYEDNYHQEPVYVQPAIMPMNPAAFGSFLVTVDEEMMTSDKMRVIGLTAATNFFNMEQLIQLLGKFTFDDDRLKIIELIYPKVLNTENAHLLFNYVTFSSSKDKLEQIIRASTH